MPGKIYSKDLGINLESGEEKEVFKWFLACVLFGKPIQQNVARLTYFEFVKNGLVSPDKILKAGWEKLVKALDKGHYVRYDYSTADKLLEICRTLKKEYGGVMNLIKSSKDLNDLRKRLEELKGVGPVTSGIFIRDIKMYFNKYKKIKRIFVAVKSSAKIQSLAFEWSKDKRDWPVRWVPNENLHVTLAPPWDEGDIGAVEDKLGGVSREIKPFNLSFERIVYGPRSGRYRLIWAEGGHSPELEELKKIIEKSLGVGGKKRELLPHVTLARFGPESFLKLKNKNLNEKIDWTESVQSFELIESVLLPAGAQYKVLKSFMLGPYE